ncbi:MAG TPA: autotransporter domain-containing protein [Magnetococcales bacterium]|nr:autotransporter domain-containing protein [Magnetococcales bacterium]
MKRKSYFLSVCLALSGGLFVGDAFANSTCCTSPDKIGGSAWASVENTETRSETNQQVRLVFSRLASVMRPSIFRAKMNFKKVAFNVDEGNLIQHLASRKQDHFDAFEGMTGVSAGSGELMNGVWGKYSIVDTTDRSSGLSVDTVSMDTSIGYDRMFANKLIIGLAPVLGQSTQKIERNATSKSDTVSLSLNPYAAFKFNDIVSLYALAGYTWADGDRLIGDYEKSMISTGILGYFPAGDIQLTGNIGFWASTTNPADSDNETVLNQLNASVEASYPVTTSRNVIEPYAALALEMDTNYEKARGYDPNGGVVSLGTRVAFSEALSGDIKFSDTIQRGSIKEYGLDLQINFRF